MSEPIRIGAIRITQRTDGDLDVTHTGKAGVVTIIVSANKLARWIMRLLREEAFA